MKYHFYNFVRVLVILGLMLSNTGSVAYAQEGVLPAPEPISIGLPPTTGSLPIEGQPWSQTGWFSIIWGDGIEGASQMVYTLTDDSGQTTVLLLDETLAQPLGGVLALNRKYVSVQGVWAAPLSAQSASQVINVTSISLAPSPGTEALDGDVLPAVSGSQPWISIMCKFNDVGTEPKNLAYFQGMYGSSWPGLDHYWRELSYNTINVVGSTAVGWYTLPQPRSYYVYNNALDRGRAATDCTGVADPYVNFAGFVGINLMFNDTLDGYSWGGGYYMTLDGVSKVWRMTWEPPWGYSHQTVMAHEMGHSFGLPHSSGNYGQTYDNIWDVMSDAWTNWPYFTDPTYGCLGQHTISYHKDRLGWIPSGQKFTAGQNTNTTITLEQLALPTNTNYKMAQIPINGSSTHFYTVEVRRPTGYDVKLPGRAVVIHEVDTTRIRPAYVIDADGNGNTGDAGAMWTVGETFSDPANAIYVYVSSATATGFQVSINTLPFSTISGYVRTSTGTGISGVTMNGLPHNPTTDANGYYSDPVINGWSGTVTPSKTVYVFNPINLGYTNVTSDQPNQNYTGSNNYTGIYYVKQVASGTGTCQSWDNACTLQDALTTALNGDEIWVAAGAHKPTTVGDRSATFQLVNGVALYGGFAGIETARNQRNPAANVTILSGDIGPAGDNSDNSYHVVTGATGGTLDGFTITAGNANGTNHPYNSGGGMYNTSGSSPTLADVTFSGNSAENGGGMYNIASNPTLTNVTFNSNSADYGGGMYNIASNTMLTNVTFSGNTAGNGGGMYNNGSSPTLTNVTFSGNSAGSGGGMYNFYSCSPILTNVTFSGNSAQSGGGLYNMDGSQLQIRNTILWGNTASIAGTQIYNNDSSTSGVSYSVVQGGCPAQSTCTNILSADPKLGTLGNYGGSTQTIPLLPGSSAFNAGNDATCAATDQRGIARPQGAHCDIGAFEVLAENTPPETMITNKPASLDNDSTPTFTFSGDDGTGIGVASFMCRMDGGTYTECTSPFTSPTLADGSHTFYVYAIDMFGNTDASPASYTWTLDSLSPNIASIVRTNPNPDPTDAAASVDFTITFSDTVTDVDASDFTLTKTGTITGESVTGISGGPIIYTITVSTGTGSGNLRLDVPASATITSIAGHLLAGLPYTDGEIYTIRVYILFLPLILR